MKTTNHIFWIFLLLFACAAYPSPARSAETDALAAEDEKLMRRLFYFPEDKPEKDPDAFSDEDFEFIDDEDFDEDFDMSDDEGFNIIDIEDFEGMGKFIGETEAEETEEEYYAKNPLPEIEAYFAAIHRFLKRNECIDPKLPMGTSSRFKKDMRRYGLAAMPFLMENLSDRRLLYYNSPLFLFEGSDRGRGSFGEACEVAIEYIFDSELPREFYDSRRVNEDGDIYYCRRYFYWPFPFNFKDWWENRRHKSLTVIRLEIIERYIWMEKSELSDDVFDFEAAKIKAQEQGIPESEPLISERQCLEMLEKARAELEAQLTPEEKLTAAAMAKLFPEYEDDDEAGEEHDILSPDFKIKKRDRLLSPEEYGALLGMFIADRFLNDSQYDDQPLDISVMDDRYDWDDSDPPGVLRHGLNAVPVLLKYADSTHVFRAGGECPLTVGRFCREMMKTLFEKDIRHVKQTLRLNPQNKTRQPAGYFDAWDDRLPEWWEAQKGKTLAEIRAEIVRWYIAQEKEIGFCEDYERESDRREEPYNYRDGREVVEELEKILNR